MTQDRRTGGRPRRALLAFLLTFPLLAASVELHPGPHDELSEVAASAGGSRVVTHSHPERSAACFERAALKTLPPCPGCLLRLQNGGGHLLAPAHAALPRPTGILGRVSTPSCRAAERHPASARGPPTLL